ncbi:MAG: LytTR family DNA-binding domain-containing protein [candidate division KSB1 bacterium]|nr:LytTR family DNA-binding domain-containing protein [candidate division KSB1 bacterium]
MKIRTLIIDDETLARSRLKRMLAQYEHIEILGEAQNGQEGLELIEKFAPDLIFLDIKMPLLSGFEMLTQLKKSPYIIFTTAYDQYALQAFEENTIDYLLKPIAQAKLDRAISKATQMLPTANPIPLDLEQLLKTISSKQNRLKRFSVKVGERIFIIPDDEIYFFHAEDKYTFLNTAKADHIIPFTLKELEEKLDPERFCRVHRSFIVNLEKIEAIHKWFGGKLQLKMKNGKELIVSQNYVSEFKQKIHYV